MLGNRSPEEPAREETATEEVARCSPPQVASSSQSWQCPRSRQTCRTWGSPAPGRCHRDAWNGGQGDPLVAYAESRVGREDAGGGGRNPRRGGTRASGPWTDCTRDLFVARWPSSRRGCGAPTAAHEGIVSDCCGDDRSRRWARGSARIAANPSTLEQPPKWFATSQPSAWRGACRCSSGTRITLLSPCSSVRRWRQRAAQPGGSPGTGRRDTTSDTALRHPAAGTGPLPATHGG